MPRLALRLLKNIQPHPTIIKHNPSPSSKTNIHIQPTPRSKRIVRFRTDTGPFRYDMFCGAMRALKPELSWEPRVPRGDMLLIDRDALKECDEALD